MTAKLSKIPRVTAYMPNATRYPDVVKLTMNRRTAEVLRALCGMVGGDPSGPRGSVDAVAKALDDAGILYDERFRDRYYIFGRIDLPDEWPPRRRNRK